MCDGIMPCELLGFCGWIALFHSCSDSILPPRALDRRLQEDWVRDAGEGPRVLMSLRVELGPIR